MTIARANGSNNARSISTTSPREALLLIDLITDFDFEDGDRLYESTRSIISNVGELKKRAHEAGSPVIYVNDNFQKWDEDLTGLVSRIRSKSEKGTEILEKIAPSESDYYVLKPQRSGFYATPLGVLLMSLGVSRVVLAGVTTDICVLFTAHDAYMRGYGVAVPNDTTAAVTEEFHRDGMKLIERVAEADIGPAKNVEFATQGAVESDDLIGSRYQIGPSRTPGLSPL
jgi:nicotinamidase-related amidase